MITNIRIRRSNPRNWVIEHYRLVQRKDGSQEYEWEVWGYYGNVSDMLHGLLDPLLPVKLDDDLKSQIETLETQVMATKYQLIEWLEQRLKNGL